VAVIAVIQQKGGVGKSTITANVAGELVRKGRAVKILDLDPQQSRASSHGRSSGVAFSETSWSR
jgi:chromosome partitioning protein